MKKAMLTTLLAIGGFAFAMGVDQPSPSMTKKPISTVTNMPTSMMTKAPNPTVSSTLTLVTSKAPILSATQQEALKSFVNLSKVPDMPTTPSLAPSTSEQISNPTVIAIKDNQMINVTLSSSNINRLYVKDDPIVHVNTPISRLCNTNDSMMNGSTNNTASCMSNDATGSVYFNVNGEKPFTVYIQTKKSRHFSLLIIPQDQPGQTIELNPITPYDPSQDSHIASAKPIEQASSF